MTLGGLETRWWNLSAGVLAMSVIGCGPSVVLIGDTEGTTTGGMDSVGDDLPATTGGIIQCETNDQCPAGLFCIEGVCMEEYSEEYYDEYDDYKDYSDYMDVMYCYEYGPKGNCCDYYECPTDCVEPEDCEPGQACIDDRYGSSCITALPLPECPEALSLLPIPIDDPAEIILLAFVDADGDAQADLLVAHAGGGADLVRMNNPVPQPLPLPAVEVRAAASGDFNGDTFQDLVVSGDDADTWVLTGDAGGAFTLTQTISGNGVLVELAALQFDGGGALDLLARNTGEAVLVYRNNGAGTLGTAIGLDGLGGIAYSVTTGEINGSIPSDVVVSRPLRDEVFLGADVVPNSVNPTATDTLSTPQGERLLNTADFNGDGTMALIGATMRADWTLLESVRPEGAASYAIFEAAQRAGIADVNGDLVPDLVLVGQSLVWARGSAADDDAEVFDCYGTEPISFVPTLAVVGDYDGNGLGDLAMSDGTELLVLAIGG